MKNPYFFGYGSLVNVGTHAYGDPRPARLKGWRRSWVQTEYREMAFLSVEPDAASEISGLVAVVPGADWGALDEREFAYRRFAAEHSVEHDLSDGTDIQAYRVPSETQRRTEPPYAVWMSYLDVVVQGYLRVFGETGVAAFFDTTDGWDRPFGDDRESPKYPRAQVLTPHETELVDHYLAQTKARRIRA